VLEVRNLDSWRKLSNTMKFSLTWLQEETFQTYQISAWLCFTLLQLEWYQLFNDIQAYELKKVRKPKSIGSFEWTL
jgi:hypothetical protein